MRLKDADDFFEKIGQNLYKFNDSTIALLEKYCDSREHCDEVILHCLLVRMKNVSEEQSTENAKKQMKKYVFWKKN